MKGRIWNRTRERLGVAAAGVLLALGLVTGPGSAASVEAAEKIPISSAEDLMNMENDPDGDYYLTQDVTLPADMKTLFSTYDLKFTGTLDGKGHKLKNYTVKSTNPENIAQITTGIFGYADHATFKNFSLTNVDIDIDAGENGANVNTLVVDAKDCKFDKIKVSGKITVTGNLKGKSEFGLGPRFQVGGLIGYCEGYLTNCSSSLKIKVKTENADELCIGGLACSLYGFEGTGSAKNCSFSGSVSASVKCAGSMRDFMAAGLCGAVNAPMSGCKNSGNITLSVKKGSSDHLYGTIGAFGIGGGGNPLKLSSCGNSGKIKASASGIEDKVYAAGLAESVFNGDEITVIKCWNTGSVSASGAGASRAAGLCIEAGLVEQSYNKGAISASGSKEDKYLDDSDAGGLCASVYGMKNCYNVGKVSLKGAGYAGGLSGMINVAYGNVTGNYSIGAVTAKGAKFSYAAALFPFYDGIEMTMKNKCMIFDNYYSGAKVAYGNGGTPSSSIKSTPKAKKVSSVTSANCPKLSSKYWTYSSKYKRLILKNNKEK